MQTDNLNNSHAEKLCVLDNLVTFVTDLLSKNNHPYPEGWYAFLHRDAFTTTDLSIQRFLINRTWRFIMSGVVEENTMDIRYCMIDNGEHHDWARLFEKEVLPCILKYNLPKVRH